MPEDKPLSRGWRRARELSISAEAERKQLETGLFDCLGRPPTAVDIVAIEALSSATIRARRQRAAGRNDGEALKLVAQLLRASGLKPAPPSAAAAPTLQAQLAARGYQPPADDDDETDDETAVSEASA